MSNLKNGDLRSHVRQKLESGALPLRGANQKLFGGRGADELCDCCGHPVGTSDVLYEVESPEHSPLAMHLPCFEAWQTESQELLGARKSSSGSAPSRLRPPFHGVWLDVPGQDEHAPATGLPIP